MLMQKHRTARLLFCSSGVMGFVEAMHIAKAFVRDPSATAVAVSSRIIAMFLVAQNIAICVPACVCYAAFGLLPYYQAKPTVIVMCQMALIFTFQLCLHLFVQGNYMVLHVKALRHRLKMYRRQAH
eukprot:NODE_14886_length_1079_cov_8.098739.p1 GENE.NODE_14886_length_1079_cov_8.098739~~NODE_14886_length_1079_cov_8.098739.p1  ORF type:complete len:126 (-),score=28.45 NODE_14886_length_1079_cov_8.098739:247-624(-)